MVTHTPEAGTEGRAGTATPGGAGEGTYGVPGIEGATGATEGVGGDVHTLVKPRPPRGALTYARDGVSGA